MSTATAKKNAHIVEYVLYVWQMEDLVRAAQFSETAIEAFQRRGRADCDWLLKAQHADAARETGGKGPYFDARVQTELACCMTPPAPWRIRCTSAPSRLLAVLQELEQNKMGEACAIRPKPC